MEKKLNITENGRYKNVDAYSLSSGDHFISTKRFAEAKEIPMPAKGNNSAYSFFTAAVSHNGQDVSFIIKKKEEAAAFNACGGIGDNIKTTLSKEMYVDKKGVDRVKKTLSFEKV